MDRGACPWGYNSWGRKEADTTERQAQPSPEEQESSQAFGTVCESAEPSGAPPAARVWKCWLHQGWCLQHTELRKIRSDLGIHNDTFKKNSCIVMLLEDASEPTQFQNWQMRDFPAPTAVTDNQIETEKVFLH